MPEPPPVSSATFPLSIVSLNGDSIATTLNNNHQRHEIPDLPPLSASAREEKKKKKGGGKEKMKMGRGT